MESEVCILLILDVYIYTEPKTIFECMLKLAAALSRFTGCSRPCVPFVAPPTIRSRLGAVELRVMKSRRKAEIILYRLSPCT